MKCDGKSLYGRMLPWFFLVLFILVFVLSFLTPMLADDYSYSFSYADRSRISSLADIYASLQVHRAEMNGRMAAHFFAHLFLMLPKFFFCLANALVAVGIFRLVYLSLRSGDDRCDFIILLTAGFLVWLYTPVFGQVFLWLDGACNYAWAFLFIYAFIYPYFSAYLFRRSASPFGSFGKMLFLPLVFLMLLGDFPRTDGCALFALYRVGRVRWLQGQLLFVLLAVLSFLVCIAAGVTLPALGRLQGGANWSETVRLYTRTFPEQAQSFAAELIPEQLYNQMRPAAALLHTCLLQLLYLLILALWMLRFWCARRRRLGFFTAVLLVALGAASAMLGGGWMWAFPLAHANVWLRHSAVLRQVAFPLWGSYLALAALAAALAVLDLRAARRYNFLDTAEVE